MKKRKSVAPCPVWGDVPPGYGRLRGLPRGPAGAAHGYLRDETQNGFVRGFIAAGLVAVTASQGAPSRESLRLALQGGTAMATGIAGANALDRRDYGTALLAVAVGAAGLKAINYALPTTRQTKKSQTAEESCTDEQEEA